MATTADLISQARIKIDDLIEPYLVPDSDIVTALSNAQYDFALHTLCVYSATTTLNLLASNAWVTRPTDIIFCRTIVRSNGKQIRPATSAELDYGAWSDIVGGTAIRQPAWRALVGDPRFVVTDLDTNKWRLVPIPIADEAVEVEMYTIPQPITLTHNPEIPEQYQSDLVIGAAVELYGSQNIEIYNPQVAAKWLEKWQRALDTARMQLDTASRVTDRRFILPRTIEYKLERLNKIYGAGSNPTPSDSGA